MVRRKLVILLFLLLSVGGSGARGATPTCTHCTGDLDVLKKKEEQKKRTADYLKLNQDYLIKNQPLSHSIEVKVKSNLAIALIQSETVENEIILIKSQLQKKRCDSCMTQ